MTQEKHNSSAIVIGGGVSGLATAALLAKNGYQVTLFEKNKTLGGRARVLRKYGFQFDMGPSWYLMPEVFEKYFALFGKSSSDFYKLKKLNPRYKMFFGEERSAVLADNIKDNIKVFESIEKGAGKKLEEYLNKSKSLYELSTKNLIYENISSISFLTTRNVVDGAKLLLKNKIWGTWESDVAKHFKNRDLQKILSFHSVFLGATPALTPAFYSMLAWADFGGGVWYPEGGMGKVIMALESLCREYEVNIQTDREVEKINVKDGKVVGVRVDGKEMVASVVVGACDLAHLEKKLLEEKYQTYDKNYWKKKNLGISALLIYLGLSKRLKGVNHHSIYVSENWDANFESIFKTRAIPEDPSFYVSARSVTDRAIVPKGSEELFVLVPIAPKTAYKKTDLAKLTERTIAKVEKIFGQEFKKSIVVKETFTPKDFAFYYNAEAGSALGLAHTFGQSLWLRPGNKSRKVQGLYYAGQYTNPGIGMPMALISAMLVSDMLNSKTSSKEIFKKGSTTYFYSSLFFRGQVRDDVFTLYAYVRVIDDFVDKEKPDKESFDDYYKETRFAWKSGVSKYEVVEKFVNLAKRKDFKWEWVDAFWTAMRQDTTKKNYKNWRELEDYMYGSAEVIGLMMAKILSLPKASWEAARLQGKAMQFINFVRDVEEDEMLGRNYLGYTKKVREDKHAWESFVRENIEKYWEIQKDAEKGYKFIPKKYLVPIKTAAEMYSWTAREIYKNPSIVFEKKVKPNKSRVVATAIKNLISL